MEKKSNGGLIAIIVVLIIALLGVCFYVAYDKGLIFNNKEEVEDNEENEKQVSDELLNELISKLNSEKGLQEVVASENPLYIFGLFDNNGNLTSATKIISEQSSSAKLLFINGYLGNNNMVTTIKGEDYSICEAGSGICSAVNKEEAESNAKKLINEDYSKLHDEEFKVYGIYDNKYVYTYGGWTYTSCIIDNDFTAYYDENDIIVQNDAELLKITDYSVDIEKDITIKYNFKLNSNNEYYLYSIAVE